MSFAESFASADTHGASFDENASVGDESILFAGIAPSHSRAVLSPLTTVTASRLSLAACTLSLLLCMHSLTAAAVCALSHSCCCVCTLSLLLCLHTLTTAAVHALSLTAAVVAVVVDPSASPLNDSPRCVLI